MLTYVVLVFRKVFFRYVQSVVSGSCRSRPIGPVSCADPHRPCSPTLDKIPVGQSGVNVLLYR